MPAYLRHGLAKRCDLCNGIRLVQAFDGIVHECQAAKSITCLFGKREGHSREVGGGGGGGGGGEQSE